MRIEHESFDSPMIFLLLYPGDDNGLQKSTVNLFRFRFMFLALRSTLVCQLLTRTSVTLTLASLFFPLPPILTVTSQVPQLDAEVGEETWLCNDDDLWKSAGEV